MCEPLGIAVAERRDAAAGNGDKVGRGRTHVGKERVRINRRHGGRTRMPISGGDVGRVLGHAIICDKARTAGVKVYGRRESPLRKRRQGRHALRMRRENIAEFAGHGHRVDIGSSDLRVRFVECALGLVQSLPEWQRHL